MMQIFTLYLIGTLMVLWFLLMLSNDVLKKIIAFISNAISIDVYFQRCFLPKEKDIHVKEIYIRQSELARWKVQMAFDPDERRRSRYDLGEFPISDDEKLYMFSKECGSAVEKFINDYPQVILRYNPRYPCHEDMEKWLFEFWIKGDGIPSY